MSDDLIDRLQNPNFTDLQWPRDMFNEAAARIEALEAENARLRAALREVNEVYAGSEGIPQPISASEYYLLQLIKDMVAISRAALAGEKKDG